MQLGSRFGSDDGQPDIDDVNTSLDLHVGDPDQLEEFVALDEVTRNEFTSSQTGPDTESSRLMQRYETIVAECHR